MSTTRSCKRTAEISLPEDLWIEILWRIPAKSVGIIGCVSKFYRGLIASSDFIRQHYDRSVKTSASVILQEGPMMYGLGGHDEFQVDFDSAKSVVTARRFIKPNIDQEETQLVGCCRGIFCYNIIRESKSTRLVFWNPLTGAVRRRFAEHDDRPPSITARWGTVYHAWCFLGYDAVNDNLKVLKMMRNSEGNILTGNKAHAFAVYSSKTDSWRKVEALQNKLSMITMCYDNCDMFLEGTNCVHILVKDDAHDTIRILAFDFATHKCY